MRNEGGEGPRITKSKIYKFKLKQSNIRELLSIYIFPEFYHKNGPTITQKSNTMLNNQFPWNRKKNNDQNYPMTNCPQTAKHVENAGLDGFGTQESFQNTDVSAQQVSKGSLLINVFLVYSAKTTASIGPKNTAKQLGDVLDF